MTRTAIAILAIACGAPAAIAAPHCTPQTTRGQWVYSCEGELGVPTRQLGTCVADRNAYFTCSGWANIGGTIFQHALQGQANTNPDCTGTITYENTINGQPAGFLDINYVVYDNGSAIKGLPTNSGGVLACTLNRMGIPAAN